MSSHSHLSAFKRKKGFSFTKFVSQKAVGILSSLTKYPFGTQYPLPQLRFAASTRYFAYAITTHHIMIREAIFKRCRLLLAVFIGTIQVIAIAQSSAIAIAQSSPAAPQQPGSQAETLESLRARLTTHISQPRFAAAAFGIKVFSLDSGKTIFEHNPQKYFSPASNAKLYTAALALDRLGPDFRIKTSLYSTGRPDASGTLKGDLIVYGRGDPTMAARLNGGDYFKGLEPLVSQLANSGVR